MASIKLKRGQGNLHISAHTIAGLSQDYAFLDDHPAEVGDEDAKLILASHRGESFVELPAVVAPPASRDELQAQFKALIGEDPDKRWSNAKLEELIAEAQKKIAGDGGLKESQ